MNFLKNRLFELLECAVKDARELPRNLYLPNSARWHEFDQGLQLCEVCLSGAVIAGTIGLSAFRTVVPTIFDTSVHRKAKTSDKLVTIDHMRNGMWVAAWAMLYGENPDQATHFKLTSIPKPRPNNFMGWVEFDLFLDSLDLIVPQLREIEVEPPYLIDEGTMDTVVYCPECGQYVRGLFDLTNVEGEESEPTEKEGEVAYDKFVTNLVREHMEEYCGEDSTTIGDLYQSYMLAKEIDKNAADLVIEFLGVEDVKKLAFNQFKAAHYGFESVRILKNDYEYRKTYLHELLFQTCQGIAKFQGLEEFDDSAEDYVDAFLENKFPTQK